MIEVAVYLLLVVALVVAPARQGSRRSARAPFVRSGRAHARQVTRSAYMAHKEVSDG